MSIRLTTRKNDSSHKTFRELLEGSVGGKLVTKNLIGDFHLFSVENNTIYESLRHFYRELQHSKAVAAIATVTKANLENFFSAATK